MLKDSGDRSEQLAKAAKDLMLKEPFYGMFLIMLNKMWKDEIPTAAVALRGINYELWLNEKFWGEINELQHQGLLKHELLHVGFFHLTEWNHLADKDVANIAKDLEINQYISPEMLPPGPCLLESFPELKLDPKKGTQHYYDELMKGKKSGKCPNLNSLLEAMAQRKQKCKIMIGPGKGGKGGGEGEMNCPDHDTWKDFENLPEATQKLIQKQTEHILSEVADAVSKSRGTIPGEFAEILARLNKEEPPKFDWKRYLRRFTGGSIKVYTKKSFRKINKRYEGYNLPGLKIKKKKHILVAIDTSGSVSTPELLEFFHEVHYMHKTGSEVTVLQCDSAISDIRPYSTGMADQIKIFGRGGTSFDPIIDHANENLHKYTALVIFTDGGAPAPDKPRLKTLWVHSSKSSINESLPGFKIKLS